MSKRLVCWFSCGAASAVAAKLAITKNAGVLPVAIAYCEVSEEHPDNKRFLADCEKWFGMPISVMRNEDYSGSIYEVFQKTRYLVGTDGAACTRLLKKSVRKSFERPGDVQVFGYTSEEAHRLESFMDSNNGVEVVAPLIEKGMTKEACLGLIKSVGIKLPVMYGLGYQNNNCIGCVKGGMGYWNKIRIDFPDVFERMAQVEESLGRTVCKKEKRVDGKRIRVPVSLRELKPSDGDYPNEIEAQCGIACVRVAEEVADLEPAENLTEGNKCT